MLHIVILVVKSHRKSDENWSCFKGDIRKMSENWVGEHDHVGTGMRGVGRGEGGGEMMHRICSL